MTPVERAYRISEIKLRPNENAHNPDTSPQMAGTTGTFKEQIYRFEPHLLGGVIPGVIVRPRRPRAGAAREVFIPATSILSTLITTEPEPPDAGAA